MKHLIFPALAALAGLVLASGPTHAAELSGWQKGCAYKMPSGAPQSNAAMVIMYCPMLAACQEMMNQHNPNMMAMGCFGFTPSDRNR